MIRNTEYVSGVFRIAIDFNMGLLLLVLLVTLHEIADHGSELQREDELG